MRSSARQFTFEYHVKVAAHDEALALWLPVPSTDAYQQVLSTSIAAPVPLSLAVEPRHGNQILHGVLPATTEAHRVVIRHLVERVARRAPPPQERGSASTWAPEDLARFLQADAQVPIDGPIAELAASVVSPDAPPRARARRIFDHLLATLDYDARGCTPERAHELGDLAVACDLKRGTCTEFHGLYVARARALGLPARFAFGFNVPPRPTGRIAGYHCWAEVFLPDAGWFAVDVSEAAKRADPEERSFYFGNLDADRVQFTTGRDVSLVPPPRTGPVDRFIFPLAEVAGRRTEVELEFSFVDEAQREEEP